MLAGQKLGPFEIEKELGSGAMGTVYQATYTKTGQKVAVKVMAPGLGTNEKAMARFEREAAILKQLRHPNIVRLFGHGRSHGTVYYAMEFIEGETIDQAFQRRGRITWEEVVALGKQLCAALQHAHEQGIVHRDLKPSNLMLLPDGTLKLTDFGIAKDLDVTQLTSANCTVGTASYMSPEQCRGERNLSNKCDLYSMGVVFYELLTGRKPFEADNAMEMFLLHCQGTFERPARLVLDIPVWLDTLVCQLLEKKPEHRALDAATVGVALDRVAEKVTAQQSAGLDRATARLKDQPEGVPKRRLDETDKEAARTLLAGAGKSRRKERKQPFYEKGWFITLGVLAILGSLGGILYVTFKPPTADQLYAHAQKLMEPDNPDNYDRAKEVLNEFLRRYDADPRADQITNWANRIDAHEKEAQLRTKIRLARNLKRTFQPDDDLERLAYLAVRYEEFGDAGAARARWQELKQKHAESKKWLALADKRIRELSRVAPAPAEEPAWRVEFLQKKLEVALNLLAEKQWRDARAICDDIIDLYRGDPQMEPFVEQARNLKQAEPSADKPKT